MSGNFFCDKIFRIKGPMLEIIFKLLARALSDQWLIISVHVIKDRFNCIVNERSLQAVQGITKLCNQ